MKSHHSSLSVLTALPIRASHAGLYICPGEGWHQEFKLATFELIFVRKGCLRMYEEKRQFTVHPGQTLLLWPNRRHGGVGTYPPDTQFYWLHFHVDKIDRSRRSGEKITLPQTGTPRRAARLFELFHRYLHEFQGAFSPGIAADLLTCEILLEAGTIHDPGLRQEDGSLAAKAKAVIDAGFHQPLGLENLASSLGYSVDYVRNKFKSAYGQTPGQYLGQRRVEAARLLLRDRALRIKEVALKCGFGSEQYLSRVFRKHEGISPGEYRSLHSRVSINIH